MNSILTIMIAVAMLSVLAVLAIGIAGFVQGGEFNKKYGNKLMQARVVLQGVALALIALAFLLSQK
ncbi:MAG: twin transmembrane helix small protein [Micavibrio aeruginosavorus]|uniref:Twin transmembrane helix small protein n=1 Tax=Micavibrio aeruginosavorus TaxID=349221 RepID=A0A2W5HF79_9BACT|nr:MAG: twin transmembrane helix small protein [Micavibrio aeruginosavorus]